MRLLIDTHLLLWWLTSGPQLPERAKELIRDPENTVFVSAVSAWEIRLKESLEKLRIPGDFSERLEAEPFEKLPLTVRHTAEIVGLQWHHRDPFDRMLVAQARVEEMFLLTADAAVAKYGNFVLLVK
jgi:PIN domain nuclease of toxin-antitoxin system